MNQELNSGETRPENLLNLTDTTAQERGREEKLRKSDRERLNEVEAMPPR